MCGVKAWVSAEGEVLINFQIKRLSLYFSWLFLFWLFSLFVLTLQSGTVTAATIDCRAKPNICAWTDKIVGIKTPNMVASGIQITPDLIVTNRHVAEDHSRVLVRNADGKIQAAMSLPHDFPADLVLLSLETSQPDLNFEIEISKQKSDKLYVVAFDQGRNGPRVYTPGLFAHYPDSKALPQARIHTDARALPGNSGGAVVNEDGQLLGVLASGDGKLSEVIPAVHINAVLRQTDEVHQDNFLAQASALRICADTLHYAAQIPRDPPLPMVSKINSNCRKAGNKQLYDQAGRLFGKWWMFEESEMFLLRSQKLDPYSPNTLMSLAVTYHLNRTPEKERPVLKRYLQINPSNPQALRLGIQTAGMLKDKAFADEVLALMRKHNPAALPLAESFVKEAFAD